MTLNKGLKRKRVSQIEEIAFDFNARQDYLTGFHKRKLERTKHAQNIAVKKEKEIKLESRRQLRAERKSELERFVKSVGELLSKGQDSWKDNDGSDVSEEAEWNGISIEENLPVDHEDVYEEEDRNTIVVVEEVDITRHGFEKARGAEQDDADSELYSRQKDYEEPSRKNGSTLKKRTWSPIAPKRDKQKKKNFRYETKAERKITKSKERAGNAKARARRKE